MSESDLQNYTYEGIDRWYRRVFKRAGWMLLSLRDGESEKIQAYIHDIERLLEAIVSKGKRIQEEDRKEDLRIIFKNVDTLYEHMKLVFQ
jgi:hypothetical protein